VPLPKYLKTWEPIPTVGKQTRLNPKNREIDDAVGRLP
jgi:hypothetical protein